MTSHEHILLVCTFLMLPFLSMAQQGPSEGTHAMLVRNEVPTTPPSKNVSVSQYYTKRMPATVSGFAVELMTSDMPLERSYILFQHFGKVFYDKTRAGEYSYLILMDFNKKKAVEHFIENVVKHRAPTEIVVYY